MHKPETIPSDEQADGLNAGVEHEFEAALAPPSDALQPVQSNGLPGESVQSRAGGWQTVAGDRTG